MRGAHYVSPAIVLVPLVEVIGSPVSADTNAGCQEGGTVEREPAAGQWSVMAHTEAMQEIQCDAQKKAGSRAAGVWVPKKVDKYALTGTHLCPTDVETKARTRVGSAVQGPFEVSLQQGESKNSLNPSSTGQLNTITQPNPHLCFPRCCRWSATALRCLCLPLPWCWLASSSGQPVSAEPFSS